MRIIVTVKVAVHGRFRPTVQMTVQSWKLAKKRVWTLDFKVSGRFKDGSEPSFEPSNRLRCRFDGSVKIG
jgi:hypothetical protein